MNTRQDRETPETAPDAAEAGGDGAAEKGRNRGTRTRFSGLFLFLSCISI